LPAEEGHTDVRQAQRRAVGAERRRLLIEPEFAAFSIVGAQGADYFSPPVSNVQMPAGSENSRNSFAHKDLRHEKHPAH